MKPGIYDVIIVGGGLAGLTAANLLAKKRVKVLLIEKNEYPFHKVCGEYLSREVLPLLSYIGLDVSSLGASEITELIVSGEKENNVISDLDLGGIGISRYKLDEALYRLAITNNAEVLIKTRVQNIFFQENKFTVTLSGGDSLQSKFVIGSYGKREALDRILDRNFLKQRTGFMAVKYHVKCNYPLNRIGLYLFKDGYCGIVKIEEDKYSISYLMRRSNMKNFKTIKEMEEKVLYKNLSLKEIFTHADFLYDKPEVINEISFAKKNVVEDHIIMCGDTGGLITPLCGNGMSMAIRSAQLACEKMLSSGILQKAQISEYERKFLEKEYNSAWSKEFKTRLFFGKIIQNIFNRPTVARFVISFLNKFPDVFSQLIRKTHGEKINVPA